MTTAMTTFNGAGAAVDQFDPFQWSSSKDMIAACEWMAQSQFVPQAFRGRAADVALAIIYGRDLGLAPLQALQNMAVINGKPCVYGDLLLALIQSHPEYAGKTEKIEGEGDKMHATCTIRRKLRLTGEIEESTESFSMEDAKKADLIGKAGPWKQYPKRMLMWRARGYAIRNLFADALRGVWFREEAEDIPGTPTVLDRRRTGSDADALNAAMRDRRIGSSEESEDDDTPDRSTVIETLRTDLAAAKGPKQIDAVIRAAWEAHGLRRDIVTLTLAAIDNRIRANGLDARKAGAIVTLLETWQGAFAAVDAECAGSVRDMRTRLEAYLAPPPVDDSDPLAALRAELAGATDDGAVLKIQRQWLAGDESIAAEVRAACMERLKALRP